jgi:hypothetical protein
MATRTPRRVDEEAVHGGPLKGVELAGFVLGAQVPTQRPWLALAEPAAHLLLS